MVGLCARVIFVVGVLVVGVFCGGGEKEEGHTCYADRDWGPPLFRGVSIYAGNSDRHKLAESIARHSCNGGNWISLNVPCAQPSLTDADSLKCAENIEGVVAADIELIRCVDPHMSIFLSPFPSHNTATTWQAHIGYENFEDEKFWDRWFAVWTREMTRFAKLANLHHVEMLGIGLELTTAQKKATRWRDLIEHAVRAHYQGHITLGSDKYSETKLKFWDALDLIGVDAYYQLAENNTDPSINQLTRSWGKWVDGLQDLYQQFGTNKPVVFTEVGYRSLSGTNVCPGCWGLQGDVSLKLQARLFESLFRAVCTKKFFAGLFVHGWGIDVQGELNNTRNDGYSVIGKPAEDVLAKWFLAKNVNSCREKAPKVADTCVLRALAKLNAAHISTGTFEVQNPQTAEPVKSDSTTSALVKMPASKRESEMLYGGAVQSALQPR